MCAVLQGKEADLRSRSFLTCFFQGFLVRPIGKIRQANAQKTDERVRLASEAIQGALSMKMLGWEVRARGLDKDLEASGD